MRDDDSTPTSVEAILAAYEWRAGRCFKCGAANVPTAPVGELPQCAGAVAVSACKPCVLRLEQDRERAAERYGWPYAPGTPVA